MPMTRAPVAIVTGGASGIGAACVRKFAAGGFTVIIADIDEDKAQSFAAELAAENYCVRSALLDVASEASVLGFTDSVARDTGHVDVLINSAGLLQGAVRVTDMTLETYDLIQAVNVRGAMLVSRALGARMMEAGTGSIVNLCSIASLRPSSQPAYATAKAGLKMLTEIMAAEFGPRGVRVNAVAPGYTMTPLMRSLVDEGKRDPAQVAERSALGRFVEPEEIADGIWFLCSPAARSITGITMPIDCGWLVRSSYLSYATTPA